MADSVVSFVLENLSRLVAHEANLLRGVEGKVRSLEDELRLVSLSLKRSDQNQRKTEIEQEFVRQFTEVAHEAEDVIDTFVANVAIYRSRNWFSKMFHVAEQAKLRHDVAEKIDKIKAILSEIHGNKSKYDTHYLLAESSTDQELQLLHKRRREVEEDDVVGFQHDTTQVINLLKQGGSSRNVVSIIGMGGLGKTTLARKVYNSPDVKDYFECHAWAYVSNDYRPRDLLHALLKCLMPFSANSCSKPKKKPKDKGKAKQEDDNSLSEEELKDKVRECLNGKKYLVVLDDIWESKHWDDIHDAFPDDNTSSRILITSRGKDVASHASSSPPYHLPFLGEEQGWELFSKRVFQGEAVPSDLELLGKRMVKCCGGLPISLVVLAGILANKKSYREWSKIMDYVNLYITQPETKVRDIVLQLSYDSLPQRLRPCLLYFGMFPEDYEIPVRRLIRLWVAEGFILHGDRRVAEDVAENYLDELIDLNLIQIGRRRSDGGIKTCRIHDLLRELCITTSKEQKVVEVCRDVDILMQTKPRRLSIQCNLSDYFASSNIDHSHTRSVICFEHGSRLDLDSINSKRFVKWFKLARVVDLGIPVLWKHEIPTSLNMLVHLRYLRIDLNNQFCRSFVTKIPEFICNLWNLECLDFGHSVNVSPLNFSGGMWKLKRLRHLYSAQALILPEFPDVGSTHMWNLQTLSYVAIHKNSAIMSLIEKDLFPNLRTLGLFFDGDEQQKQGLLQVWGILPNLRCLTSLKICSFFYIPTTASAFPFCLTKLTIMNTDLSNDVMGTLGSLTNLRILKLWSCEVRADSSSSQIKLCCINGFPQLEVFQMQYLNELCRWELGKDVMPCLRRLIIVDCEELTGLPDELWSLFDLREVQVKGPSESLKMQLQSQPMKDGCNLIIS